MTPATNYDVGVGSDVRIISGKLTGRAGRVETVEWQPGVMPLLTVELTNGGYTFIDLDCVELPGGAA
jgi:transcription antitermination factor NusG